MKKIIYLASLAIIVVAGAFTAPKGDIYKTVSGKVTFTSTAKDETFTATSSSLSCVLNSKNSKAAFEITMKTFDFANNLMEKHFQENYVEIKKFPKCKFTGAAFTGAVNYAKAGDYTVSVTGSLDLHGVKKSYTVPATITVVNANKIKVACTFKIALADHNISRPKTVEKKVAENIDIVVDATLNK